jgi:hypothetical protein
MTLCLTYDSLELVHLIKIHFSKAKGVSNLLSSYERIVRHLSCPQLKVLQIFRGQEKWRLPVPKPSLALTQPLVSYSQGVP